jgi:hypothetical protein
METDFQRHVQLRRVSSVLDALTAQNSPTVMTARRVPMKGAMMDVREWKSLLLRS